MKKNVLTRLLQASLMCCLAVLFTACEDLGMESNPTPSYISFNSKPVTLNIEQTVTYQAIVAGTAVVIYSSSDETVATVDQAGKVTAVSPGTAIITALVTGYDAAGRKIYTPEERSYMVTVVDPVESLTLDQTSLSVGIGATKTITATVNPTGYTVKWTSSDESVATVENGVVTGVAEGTATITAKAGGKVKTCEVTVSAAWAANEYNKGSWNSTLEKVEFAKKTADATPVVLTDQTASIIIWDNAWVTVSGNVTLTGTVRLTNDVHLILQDGATLTITGQLDCRTNNKNLYIYGQEKGDGKLNVTNNSGTAINSNWDYRIEIHGGKVTASAAGDYNNGLYTGYLAVYGGKLTATSGGGHGINFQNTFKVYGGEVVATSNATSNARYGIRSGGFLSTQILTVYGGKVTATGNGVTMGSGYGAGIGCYVQQGTTGINFYFADTEAGLATATPYPCASATGTTSDAAYKKKFAKAE